MAGVLPECCTELVVLRSDRLELSLLSRGVMALGFIIFIFGDLEIL